MMRPIACPNCLNSSFEPLIDFGIVPRSGSFLIDPNQSYPSVRLSFEFCPKCALIRRKSFEDDSYDYTHVGRSTGHRLPAYAIQIAEWFRQRGVGIDEFIVEVGANDGTFLDILTQEGFTNLLGVEPSRGCAAICHSKGHRVENVHLDQVEAIRITKQYGIARVIVCRQTLEHVPDPFGLLLAMRSLLCDDGILFIEVPDARGITHDLHGHDLWDEHLHSFTPENLPMLVYRAGFCVDETLVTPDRDTMNIILWCSPGLAEDEHPRSSSAFSSDVQICRSFAGRWASLCEQILAELPNWRRPIGCIGASHPQSNFLLFTGIGQHVAFLVDDDPAKAGCHVPIPRPVPVISTDQFLDGKPPGTVIRGAFGYEDWMDRVCGPLAMRGVHIVEPYIASTGALLQQRR